MATGTPPNSMGHASAQPDASPLAAARRHRVELLYAIQSLERALAVPARDPGWYEGVAGRLGSLRAAFAEHVVVTEGSDGLYTELLDHAPRLARGVHVLIREHAALAAAMQALQRQLANGRPAVEDVRGWASDLLREMSRHRQRGADLVYEAYATDIGGET